MQNRVSVLGFGCTEAIPHWPGFFHLHSPDFISRPSAMSLLDILFGSYDDRNILRKAISDARDAATTLSLSQLFYPSLGDFITLYRNHVTLYENQMGAISAMSSGQVIAINNPSAFVLALRTEMDNAKSDLAAGGVGSGVTASSATAYDQLAPSYYVFFAASASR